ncbi:MAG: Cys-tRNA(Pro) deacylase [Candidatus Nanopelagicales bacterium]
MAKAKDSERGSATPATVALARAGVPYALHAYRHDDRTEEYGAEAATELGVESERVFKTLVVDVDGDPVVAVVPVSGRLDLKALAAAVGGKKAALAEPADAERITGYKVGGISPLGQRRELPTVLDTTAMTYESILVSAGRRGLDLEIMPDHLVAILNARTAPIARS